MAIGRRARGRRATRRRNRAEDEARAQQAVIDQSYQEELARQRQIREDEMKREVFQTTEGQGIMEGATISLGFEEEEDELFRSGTGLII